MTAILSFSTAGGCERMSETWLTVWTSPDKIKFVVVGWKNDERFWSNQTTNRLHVFLLEAALAPLPWEVVWSCDGFHGSAMEQLWFSVQRTFILLLNTQNCEIHWVWSVSTVRDQIHHSSYTWQDIFPVCERVYFAAINVILKLNLIQFERCFMPAPGYSSREKKGNCSITTQTVTLFLLLSDSFGCLNLTRQWTQVQLWISVSDVSGIWIFPP